MRVVIKGADFENVSIGKVIKDLSFSFSITNENKSEWLLNPPSVTLTTSATTASSNNNDGAIIYGGTASDSTITPSTNNNPNRFITKFIEVTEGMTINLSTWYNGATTPILICFDANKNVMNQPNGAWSGSSYVIPTGCAFIKLQSDQMRLNQGASGTMPM